MVIRNAARLFLLSLSIFHTTAAAGEIRLKYRTIRPQPGMEPALSKGAGSGHWILQFLVYPNSAIRAEVTRRGGRVLEYVPDSALMVSFKAPPDLSGLPLAWSGRLEPRDRQAAGLNNARAFLVIFHRDVAADRAAPLLEGFQVLEVDGLLPGHYLVAANHTALPELADRDEVAFIMAADPAMRGRRR